MREFRGFYRCRTSLHLVWAAVATVLLSVACSVEKPAEETPIPTNKNVKKTFFLGEPGKPKTFMCGWAVEDEIGDYAKATSTNGYSVPSACNIRWEITEYFLLGYLINPSFPNSPDRWEVAVRIPIAKHFYLEKRKDGHGRDTNETIENAGRSEWKARPYIKLDFSSVIVDKLGWAAPNSDAGSKLNVDEIEWDFEKGFLGFTAHVSGHRAASANQARVRYNFLEFEHNPNFQKTYFPTENGHLLNPLYRIAYNVNGDPNRRVYHVGKWDLSKSHEIYLYGFPEKYRHLGQEVVDSWNQALTRAYSPESTETREFFRVNPATPKRRFDLRKSMIVWNDDADISTHSPIGVARTNIDILSGEILWGTATYYGGSIENYINTYSPAEVIGQYNSSALNDSMVLLHEKHQPRKKLALLPGLQKLTPSSTLESGLESYFGGGRNFLIASFEMIMGYLQSPPEDSSQRLQDLQQIRARFQDHHGPHVNTVLQRAKQKMISRYYSVGEKMIADHEEEFRHSPYDSLIGMKQSLAFESLDEDLAQKLQSLEPEARGEWLRQKAMGDLRQRLESVVQDHDLTIGELALGWHYGMYLAERPPADVFVAISKFVLAHELGHFLGLGHNYKDNILPDPERTPAPIYEKLKSVAKKELGYKQRTTVMGYSHGLTMTQLEDEDVLPGPYDDQALRYIYANQYPTYTPGDEEYTYKPLPSNSIIPGDHALLEQCDDVEAIYGPDPYCMQFDIGYDATTLVRSHFELIERSLIPTLFSFVSASGGHAQKAEGYLRHQAMRAFGAVRKFYDHMRWKYREAFKTISSSEDLLYGFSEACQERLSGSSVQRTYEGLFKKYKGLKELCQANALALKEFKKILALPGLDHTEMDFDRRYFNYALNGAGNFGHASGTWKELSARPLKMAALLNLTALGSYNLHHKMGMIPIEQYARAQSRYSYPTLYPFEFTQTLTEAVLKNLSFAVDGTSEFTKMGSVVQSLGYFLNRLRGTNDSLKLPSSYLESLREHSAFRFNPSSNMVFVFLKKSTMENDDNRVTHFSGEIFNFRSGQKQELPAGAYLLPNAKIIAQPPRGMFLYPLTKFRWTSDEQGYVLAVTASFEETFDDRLEDHGLRKQLSSRMQGIYDQCVSGANGLRQFFRENNDRRTSFKGFEVPPGIALVPEYQDNFYRSVRDNYKLYYQEKTFKDKGLVPRPETCEQADKGLRLIFSTVAVTSGYWMPFVWDFVLKE